MTTLTSTVRAGIAPRMLNDRPIVPAELHGQLCGWRTRTPDDVEPGVAWCAGCGLPIRGVASDPQPTMATTDEELTMQDDITTTTISTEPDDRLVYASTERMPMPLALVAIYGEREGLLTFEDLPWEMPDGAAFLVAAHKVLTDSGALGAYQRENAMNARAADCPWWCRGEHPTVFEDGDIFIHEAPVQTMTLEYCGITASAEAQVVIAAAQLDDGLDHPAIMVDAQGIGDLHELTVGSARALGAALTLAADRLEEIERVTPA